MPTNIRGRDGQLDPPRTPPEVRGADGAIVNRAAPEPEPAGAGHPSPGMADADDAGSPGTPPPGPEEPEEVLFRCEAAPDLRQYLPSGREAQFRGQYFRTRDAGIAAEMRALIDNPRITVMFAEEDIEPLLDCPHCDFRTLSYKDLKAHVRADHAGARIPPLRELV